MKLTIGYSAYHEIEVEAPPESGRMRRTGKYQQPRNQ